MAKSVLYMSMSLDGFVAGPDGTNDDGLGDGGERLHRWLMESTANERGLPGRPSGTNGEVWDAFMATGAVVAGRGTFEPAGGWGGDHHDGVPIFVLTRDPERHQPHAKPRVTFVAEVAEAMERAKDAAGDRDVLVHGVGVTRLALAAGVLDELHIHLVPVLLGEGRRLFEHLGPGRVELERLDTREGEDGVTHLRYAVTTRHRMRDAG
ncbi:dihydrofolate reductase family protein [Patulibacter americanus]|uniref:dihydrofolate reductase family protein n=1 Tax=Patulibacter americanus TaxID=588672 RepID=UPI0003B69E66|nr:dihydrofolate reductase family protein [Patulibacter americanus]